MHRKILLLAGVLALLAGPAGAGDWDDYWGAGGIRDREMAAARTPGYGEIAWNVTKGAASAYASWGRWVWENSTYSGSGNRCNCSVGGSDRAR